MKTRWLAVAWLISLAAVIAVLLGPMLLVRRDQGLPPDPSAAHVLPKAGPYAAMLRTIGDEGSHTPGTEGSILFVRLLDADGATVMDTLFDWPRHDEPIPPGSYDLVAYWRYCVGFCDNLSDEAPFCRDQVDVLPGMVVEVSITPRDLSPGTTCEVHVKRSIFGVTL